jgi:23S rRNA (cytidine1920-2'-O)/16S rRNA (cytidine1409-2'-O)-methyltransferase
MGRKVRLDAELVRRGLARSREQAADLIAAGCVAVSGQTAGKAATQVGQDAAITLREIGGGPQYASRGGRKLAGALSAFAEIAVDGRRCLDAGASTGGFTDVLLRAGAAHVVAVDVGYGQLAWPLRSDPRVTVLDRTNMRALLPEQVAPAPSLVTADLSFISLTLVLPALAACAAADADFVVLVKPQFEVGKGRVGAGGVVRDPALREEAVARVAGAALGIGLGVRGVTASPLPGPSGNVEYFLWLRRGAPALDQAVLRLAIAQGPGGGGTAVSGETAVGRWTAADGGTASSGGTASQRRRGPSERRTTVMEGPQ